MTYEQVASLILGSVGIGIVVAFMIHNKGKW